MGKHLDFPGAARRYFHNSNLSIKMILLQHESISRKGNHQSFNEHLGDSWRSSSIVRILQVEMERGKLLGTHCLSRFDLATVLWSISKFGASPLPQAGPYSQSWDLHCTGYWWSAKKTISWRMSSLKTFSIQSQIMGNMKSCVQKSGLVWSSRHKSWISKVFFTRNIPLDCIPSRFVLG